ncbi:MAG: hypothetical protein JWP00_4758 [Chloroflexi bacterium]|nr:hypothetical protein [Chloroflexota bacterium]
MKIGLLSFADCNNYGDQYFAPISRSELATYLPQAEIALLSPTGSPVEGDEYTAYDPKQIDGQYDALLLVGGEVVHTEDQLFLEIYTQQGLTSYLERPTDLVFGSAILDIPYKAWVSTGISGSIISPVAANRLVEVLPELNRVMLRGVLARDNLDAMVGRNLETDVVPDLGWLIPDYCNAEAVRWPELAELVGLKQPYMIFHTFPNIVENPADLEFIIATLKKVQQETGLQIVLLPITHYQHDSELLAQLNQQAGNSFCLVPKGLKRDEIAQILLHTTISVTSSLHGSITALAAGIPAGVIHPGETKFSDVFGSQHRLHFLKRDWSGLYTMIMELLREPHEPLVTYAELQRQRLLVMFSNLAEEIKNAVAGQSKYPYRRQFDPENNTYRRNDWLHTANLNHFLHDELALRTRQLAEKNEQLRGLKARTDNGADFPTGNLSKTAKLYWLQQQLAEAKAANQDLSTQLQSLKTDFEALQDTKTVRLTRNLSVLSTVVKHLVKAPFEEKIQGVLDQPTPGSITGLQLKVSGWAASTTGHIRAVEVYLDSIHLGAAFFGIERSEVLASRPLQLERFCGYSGLFTISSRQFKPGAKTLQVTVTDSKGNTRQFKQPVIFNPALGLSGKNQTFMDSTFPYKTPQSPAASVPSLKSEVKAVANGLDKIKSLKLNRIDEVKIYVAGAGNEFILDIARIFQYGFRENDMAAEILVDHIPELNPAKTCLQLVVAPHEFYPLFLEKQLEGREIEHVSRNVCMLNVEQPGSKWFNLAFEKATHARKIWDINLDGVAEFKRRGLEAYYAPLGYAPSLESEGNSNGITSDLSGESIDLLFLGSTSPRRQDFLAEHADFFNRYKSRLILSRVDTPRLAGTPGYISGPERARLMKQARLLLNIHLDTRPYFEWHRTLLALANRCLFVTEPARGYAPLVNGQHIILAETTSLVDVCRFYLDNEPARLEITDRAYQLAREKLDAGVMYRSLLVGKTAVIK